MFAKLGKMTSVLQQVLRTRLTLTNICDLNFRRILSLVKQIFAKQE